MAHADVSSEMPGVTPTEPLPVESKWRTSSARPEVHTGAPFRARASCDPREKANKRLSGPSECEEAITYRLAREQEVQQTVDRFVQESLNTSTYHSEPYWTACAVSEDNPARLVWNMWFALLLAYTGIVFPFKTAFFDYGIPERSVPGWHKWFELLCLDVGFWIDLVSGFFLTYRDAHGRQVFDQRLIAKRYLKGYFFINLTACLPMEFFSWISCTLKRQASCSSSTSSLNQVARLTRMQRVSRLARLIRLARISNMSKKLEIQLENKWWFKMLKHRSVRVINQCVGLLFVVHIVACGWWLVAVVSGDVKASWIHRRVVGSDGLSILELSENGDYTAMEQWLTSMYFTLTIFTTVGFGDISAFSTPEMVYCILVMAMGCIVNGILVSEMINVLSTVNEEVRHMEENRTLVRNFGEHMQVAPSLTEELARVINAAQVDNSNFDRKQMRLLLTSGILPQQLLNVLPQALFNGRLVRNKFISWSDNKQGAKVPPRFPILLALACQVYHYDEHQNVYSVQDHAWNIYLVVRGTFSYIATERMQGDVATTNDHSSSLYFSQLWHATRTRGMSSVLEGVSPYQLFGEGNYFGDIEIILEPCSRVSTARSEVKEGVLLVLHKREMFQLLEEFPSVLKRWRVAAKQRQRHRARLHGEWVGGTHKCLAARLLQKNLTMLMKRKKGIKTVAEHDYRALVDEFNNRQDPKLRRRSTQVAPTEVVPQYARIMQANIDELHRGIMNLQMDVSCLQTTWQSEVEDMQGTFNVLSERLQRAGVGAASTSRSTSRQADSNIGNISC